MSQPSAILPRGSTRPCFDPVKTLEAEIDNLRSHSRSSASRRLPRSRRRGDADRRPAHWEFGALIEEVRFAADSLMERAGIRTLGPGAERNLPQMLRRYQRRPVELFVKSAPADASAARDFCPAG